MEEYFALRNEKFLLTSGVDSHLLEVLPATDGLSWSP